MPVSLSGVSVGFPALSPSSGQVAYVFLTRPPLLANPKISLPFDLHVLGTPPAFILSQDQTLRRYCLLLKAKHKARPQSLSWVGTTVFAKAKSVARTSLSLLHLLRFDYLFSLHS